MAKRTCKGTTKKGTRCKAHPLHGTDHCLAHSDADTRGSVGFTPEAGRAGGRPRLPRPHELLREKIEADLEDWLAPYVRAREATRPVVVGRGDDAYVEMVPDYKLQLEAADAALNRVYGRPKQLLEHTGRDDGPIEHSAVPLDDESLELIRALRGRRAPVRDA